MGRVAKPLARSVDKDAARDKLIIKYQVYVEAIAGQMVRKLGLPPHMFDDFVSAGYMGLIEAASRYDKGSKTVFQSYAYMRIKGAIIDSIRRTSELSGRGYRFAKALEAIQSMQEDAEVDLGRNNAVIKANRAPTKQTIQSRKEELARILDYGLKGVLAYRMTVEDADEEISGPAEDIHPENDMLNIERDELFGQLVDQLPEKERHVIKQFYFHDKSFHEIVDEEKGYSKSWISKLHMRGIERIKQGFLKEMAAREQV